MATPETDARTDDSNLQRPLRLWPGVVLVAVQWLARFVMPAVWPDMMPYGVMAALACGPLIALWWMFFSRAPRIERFGGVALMIAALVATPYLLHESVATGFMGMMFLVYSIPLLSLALVAWAVITRGLSNRVRRVTMIASIVLACGVWALVRTGGMTGDADSEFEWRWAATPEEQLLAEAQDVPPAEAVELAGAEVGTADWPGFRGQRRDGVVPDVRIGTDWQVSPPKELWRRPVGPGWSSFAVAGDVFYTQEQRGEAEVVSAYRVSTGEPVWRHEDPARFWESNGGAGPRGTPMLDEGRIYSLGATGILNVLEAADGSVVWSRNAAADTEAEVPTWGISGSPLVLDDLVVVAASGTLAAYDRATGTPRWTGPAGGTSYTSPHMATLDGVRQVLFLNGEGLTSHAPDDGTVLWQHAWGGYPIVQPALTADGDVLIGVTDQSGLRRLAVDGASGEWTVEEGWTSIGLKPYFNDFVVHEGHAYGFDGRILACIGLDDGQRRWKGGRYGGGQLVLLADQDLLLVASEDGEVALVGATPDGFQEVAKVPVLDGKTWNHPVVIGDVLLVRNDREMAAYRLPAA